MRTATLLLVLGALGACNSRNPPPPGPAANSLPGKNQVVRMGSPAAGAAMPAMADPQRMPALEGMAEAPQAPQAPQDPLAEADELFNEAMMAHESKAPEAPAAISAALAAYQKLDLKGDADGKYHLALLQLAKGDLAAARATLDEILAAVPDHLLALGASAQAAAKANAPKVAAARWEQYLQNLEPKRNARSEYEHHAAILPIYQREAEAFLVNQGQKKN